MAEMFEGDLKDLWSAIKNLSGAHIEFWKVADDINEGMFDFMRALDKDESDELLDLYNRTFSNGRYDHQHQTGDYQKIYFALKKANEWILERIEQGLEDEQESSYP